MSERYHVAFVCLGNICRSPMAEQVFRSRLADSPIARRVSVSSAGTSGWHIGAEMDRRAAQTLQRHGYRTDHSASQFTPEDYDVVDLVLAMDADNLALLREMAPTEADRAKVRLFRSFDPHADPGAEVPDPYYGGSRGFEEVLAMVEAAADGVLRHVTDEVSASP